MYQCISRWRVLYLRLMVLHVRGATSFTDLRTVNARPSLWDVQRRLLTSEPPNAWSTYVTPHSARCHSICECCLLATVNPPIHCISSSSLLEEDFKHAESGSTQFTVSRDMLLLTLEKWLSVHDRQLPDFNFPAAVEKLPTTDICDEQTDAGAADCLAANEPLLNDDQRRVYYYYY